MKTAEDIELAPPGPRNEERVRFAVGLLGFERFTEYLWVSREEQAPFCWIQALDDPGLSFLIVPINFVLDDYQPEIPEADVLTLGLESPSDALLYGIVTLRMDGRATVNLKGPIVLNRQTGLAKQVVIVNAADYPLQYPLAAHA